MTSEEIFQELIYHRIHNTDSRIKIEVKLLKSLFKEIPYLKQFTALPFGPFSRLIEFNGTPYAKAKNAIRNYDLQNDEVKSWFIEADIKEREFILLVSTIQSITCSIEEFTFTRTWVEGLSIDDTSEYEAALPQQTINLIAQK